MKSITAILQNKSHASPLVRGIRAAQGVEAANEVLQNIFGKIIGEHAQAASIKNRILTIACLSSIVAQEIKLQENKIIATINTKLGFELIIRIKYLS